MSVPNWEVTHRTKVGDGTVTAGIKAISQQTITLRCIAKSTAGGERKYSGAVIHLTTDEAGALLRVLKGLVMRARYAQGLSGM